MAKLFKKFNFRAFVTLLTIFTLSMVLALSTACSSSNNGSSGSSSSSSDTDDKTDEQTIANGDFEWYTDKDTKYPYSSSVKWSRSYEGSSSGAYGGIIDTAAEYYDKLADANKPKDGDTVFNPGTPLAEDDADTDANEEGTKVLMLRNDLSGKGTAQYYTSSTSVTLAKEEYARVSVWVNTFGLTTPNGVKGGAYIKIKTGVDDDTPLVIKDINTGSTVGENGSKWVKYTVYVAPSVTATTKITVVLGLGDGTTPEHQVNGFAYFDNVEYKVVDAEDVPADAYKTADYYADKDSFVIDEQGATVENKVVKVNLAKTLTPATIGGSGSYNNVNFPDGIKALDNGTAGYASSDTTVGEETIKDAVYMNFANVKNAYSYTTDRFTVNAAAYTDGKKDDDNANYMAFSFLAKVKTNSSSTTNATIQVIENNSYGENVTGSFSSFSTDGEYKRYTFYLTTNYDAALEFAIRFNFGPTNDKGALPEVSALPQGYAIFKDFTFTSITKDEYTAADSTNATKVALLGDHAADHTEEDDEENTDSYSFTLSKADEFDLKTKPVDLKQTTDRTVSVLKSDENTTIGIVNSNYTYEFDGLADAFTALKAGLTDIGSDNKNVQPLLVYGAGGAGQSVIGGETVTVAANSTYEFSVKVRVSSGSAYVRLFEVAGIDGTDGVITRKIGETNYLAETTVTSATKVNRGGYALIQYIIKTGSDEKNIRIEFGLNGEGLALFDDVNAGSSASYADADAVVLDDYDFDFVEEKVGDENNLVYYYASKDDVGDASKRLKDSDGEIRSVYKDPVKAIAYGAIPDAASSQTVTYDEATVKYLRFDVEEMKYEIDSSSSDDDNSSSDDSSSSSSDGDSATVGNYAWLQIVSIIIAAVIIVALVAVIVRKALAGRKSKKAKTKAYYGGFDQKAAKTEGHRYSMKRVREEAAKTEAKEQKGVKVIDLDEADKEGAYDYGDGEKTEGESTDDNGEKGE